MIKSSLGSIAALILVIGVIFWLIEGSFIFFVSYGLMAASITVVTKCKGPPILLIPFGFQFLQINIRAIQASFSDQPIESFSVLGYPVEPAMLFCSACLIAIILGIFIFTRIKRSEPEIYPSAGRLTLNRLAMIAVLLLILGHASDFLASLAAPSRQLFEGLAYAKWVGLFVLVWLSFQRGSFSVLAILVAAFEIGLGIGGFFASFREPIYVIICAIITSVTRIRAGMLSFAAVCFLGMIWLATFWTFVKPEYREFVNRGSEQQVVLVPYEERMSYLVSQAMQFDGQSFEIGLTQLADRIAYIEYPAAVIARVPALLPYANGDQTKRAILHVLVPRIIYPQKPPLELDTILTNKYTGLHEGFSDGTSISIGYMSELYIDFGFLGAMVACLVLGSMIGLLYQNVISYRKVPSVLNIGLLMGPIISVSVFETSLTKLVGAILVSFITTLILQRFILPLFLGGNQNHESISKDDPFYNAP